MTLANLGVNGGCFRSATQSGTQVVAGTLFMFPSAIEFQIMKKLQAKYAIGIVEAYVNKPGQRTQQWEGFSLRQWQVYCNLQVVCKVDLALLRWLTPSTPKQDHIFASPITYVSNWRTAQRGFLSVPAFGHLQTTIEHMMTRAKTLEPLSQVIECDTDIPGMLKKSKT